MAPLGGGPGDGDAAAQQRAPSPAEQITALVDKLVMDRLISAESASHLREMEALAAAAAGRANSYMKRALDAEKLLADTEKKLAEHLQWEADRDSRLKDREAAVSVREKKMTELELTANHNLDKAMLMERLFNTVFRNIETRKNVMTSTPVVVPYGNYNGPGQHGGGSVSVGGNVQMAQGNDTITESKT